MAAGQLTRPVTATPALRFFTPAEEAVATALLRHLAAQRAEGRDPGADRSAGGPSPCSATARLDAELAQRCAAGWHDPDMPLECALWKASLAWLDLDAQRQFGTPFGRCSGDQQRELVAQVRRTDIWHGLDGAQICGLWTQCDRAPARPRPVGRSRATSPVPVQRRECGYDGIPA